MGLHINLRELKLFLEWVEKLKYNQNSLFSLCGNETETKGLIYNSVFCEILYKKNYLPGVWLFDHILNAFRFQNCKFSVFVSIYQPWCGFGFQDNLHTQNTMAKWILYNCWNGVPMNENWNEVLLYPW